MLEPFSVTSLMSKVVSLSLAKNRSLKTYSDAWSSGQRYLDAELISRALMRLMNFLTLRSLLLQEVSKRMASRVVSSGFI